MNPNIRIDESFVSNIIQKGGWDKLDIEVASVDTKEEVIEEAKKKKVKDLGEPGEESETVAEAEEAVHTCPLCESKLEEELTDEQLLEHAGIMAEILDQFEVIEEEEEAEEETEEEEEESE